MSELIQFGNHHNKLWDDFFAIRKHSEENVGFVERLVADPKGSLAEMNLDFEMPVIGSNDKSTNLSSVLESFEQEHRFEVVRAIVGVPISAQTISANGDTRVVALAVANLVAAVNAIVAVNASVAINVTAAANAAAAVNAAMAVNVLASGITPPGDNETLGFNGQEGLDSQSISLSEDFHKSPLAKKLSDWQLSPYRVEALLRRVLSLALNDSTVGDRIEANYVYRNVPISVVAQRAEGGFNLVYGDTK